MVQSLQNSVMISYVTCVSKLLQCYIGDEIRLSIELNPIEEYIKYSVEIDINEEYPFVYTIGIIFDTNFSHTKGFSLNMSVG